MLKRVHNFGLTSLFTTGDPTTAARPIILRDGQGEDSDGFQRLQPSGAIGSEPQSLHKGVPGQQIATASAQGIDRNADIEMGNIQVRRDTSISADHA